jgi:hypothetical protein
MSTGLAPEPAVATRSPATPSVRLAHAGAWPPEAESHLVDAPSSLRVALTDSGSAAPDEARLRTPSQPRPLEPLVRHSEWVWRGLHGGRAVLAGLCYRLSSTRRI